MAKEEIFCEIKRLSEIFTALSNPDRWKILSLLMERADSSVSYTEIKRHLGSNYNDNKLWRHLRKLMEAGLIINERRAVFYPETRKAKTSFYKPTPLIQRVLEALPHLKKTANRKSSFYLNNTYIFVSIIKISEGNKMKKRGASQKNSLQQDIINEILDITIKIIIKRYGVILSPEIMTKEAPKVIRGKVKRFIGKLILGEEAPSPYFPFTEYIMEQLKEYYPAERLNELFEQATIRLPHGIEVVYWKVDFPNKKLAKIWFWSLNPEDKISFLYWVEDYCRKMSDCEYTLKV